MVARPPERRDRPDRVGRLDRAQLRIARRVAGRLRDGGLVFVVGCDDRRRRAFEAALRDEGIVVESGRLELDGDPWGQILALARTGATPCVSWADGNSESFLATFNLGRERFAELRAGLLVWIGGLDAIETFPVQVPDLWAYRAGVEWVVSTLDFRAELPKDVRTELATERLARYELELGERALDAPRRIHRLANAADIQLHLDRPTRANELGKQIDDFWSVVATGTAWPIERQRVLTSQASRAVELGRGSDVLQTFDNGNASVLLSAAAVLRQRGKYRESLDLLGSLLEAKGKLNPWSRSAANARIATVAAELGRVHDACSAAEVVDINTLDRSWWSKMEIAATAMHAVNISQLRPFDALQHAFRRHTTIAKPYSPELATDVAAPVVDGLLSLGLSADAHEFVDALLCTPNLSDRRRLALQVLRARALLASGAIVIGINALWLALDGYRTAITTAHPLSVARLSLAAIDLITRNLVHLTHTPTQANELRELGLALARSAERTALAERQEDWARDLRSAAATLLLALDRHHDARALLEQNLAWSQQHEGPSRVCRAHLELARLDIAQGQPNRALVEIERARRALVLDPPEMQPHSAWRELLLEHARVLAAAGQPQRGRAEALQARARMANAGLPAEELAVLHVLAEPFPGEGREALPERERAAAEALALAAGSSILDEEARALANFALVHAEQGRRAPAQAMIAEARWLIEERLYGRIREHVDDVGARIDALLAALTS